MPRAAAIPAAERRAHAVQALLELAVQTAPDQISTAAIAERMGVSHAALFRHFPTREALWAEAVHWATAELSDRFRIAAAEQSDPLAAIEALLTCHARFHQHHPGLLRMLFAELQRPQTSPAREEGKAFMARFRSCLAEHISRAQRQGQIDALNSPEELAGLLVAANQGLMLQALVRDNLEQLPERTSAGVRLILKGAAR